jgi:HD-like signal output (HDOD) protein
LLGLLRDPEVDMAAVGEVVSWDPALVLRMLKLVNSPAFGLQRPIDNVQHALTMIGRTQVEQIVLGVVVKQALPSAPAQGFDGNRFWRAAFFRASLARTLADRLHPADAARSFTGGLLQDMAVPLLAHARSDYGKVLEDWHASPGASLHELEKSAFGWSHDEIGAHLGVDWELPESLTQIIGQHHDATASDRELLPAMRLVARHRETACEYGIEAIVEDGSSQYGLDRDWIQSSVAECDSQAIELTRQLL